MQIFTQQRGSSTTHQPSLEKGSSEPVLGDLGLLGAGAVVCGGAAAGGEE